MPSPELAHRVKKFLAACDGLDRDDALAACCTGYVTQQRLPILNRAGAQVMAVEAEKVKGEIDEALVPAQS